MVGKIECVDPEVYCLEYNKKCPNNCGGYGYCSNGVCECKIGKTGVDCTKDGSD